MSETMAGGMMMVVALALIALAGFGVQSCARSAESERQYRASGAYRDCVVSCGVGSRQYRAEPRCASGASEGEAMRTHDEAATARVLTADEVRALLAEGQECRADVERRIAKMHEWPETAHLKAK
jgi:hypothetical protein